MSRRVDRVEKELHQIIASFILRGTRDPLEGLVTISRIKVSPDLRQALVFVSMMGEEDMDKDNNIDILNSSAYEIQREIGKKLPMKFCPKIKFKLDDSLVKALKIQTLIHEVSQEQAAIDKQRENEPESDQEES